MATEIVFYTLIALKETDSWSFFDFFKGFGVPLVWLDSFQFGLQRVFQECKKPMHVVSTPLKNTFIAELNIASSSFKVHTMFKRYH